MPTRKPIAIYHESPDVFRPLFSELDRRGVPHVHLDPREHRYDPAERESPYALVFNQTNPSAHAAGGGRVIFHTLSWLAHLDRLGVPVVNGLRAFTSATSTARQLPLLESLGLGYPATRVISHPSQAAAAAAGLRFPVLLREDGGGSETGAIRFDTPDALKQAADHRLRQRIDRMSLVQEYVPARGGHVTRVELLGGRFLYAAKLFLTGDVVRQVSTDAPPQRDEVVPQRPAPPDEAPRAGRVEGYTPPPDVVRACEQIAQATGIDVGGIEYLTDDRDGRVLYYALSAHSNFTADVLTAVGFDPFARLADYLARRSAPVPPLPVGYDTLLSSMADWDAAI